MGGKGLRRRQKNYKEAHGGRLNRLPPPPDPSKVDALPSSLRKLISLTSPLPSQDSAKDSKDVKKSKNIGADDASEPKSGPKDEASDDNPEVQNLDAATSTRQSSEIDLNWEMSQFGEDADNNAKSVEFEHKKKKKKRKRGQVEDLRFAESLKATAYGSKKREKKKKFLEAKKEKRKKGKTTGDTLDFPRDKVEFGEIVQAPPKLVQVPKASKTRKYSASQERVRLKAVEEYRQRKGWTSRPGLHLPTSVTAPSE